MEELILEYNCSIEHIAGVYNFAADDFSAMIPPNVREEVSANTCTSFVPSVHVDLPNLATDNPRVNVTYDNFIIQRNT